jgi:hypothetical protein
MSSQERLDKLKEDRGSVYGDPWDNHAGIAQMWAPLLRPWGCDILCGRPLPPDVVTRLLQLLKLNRTRLKYHPDNYDDNANYNDFSKEMQGRWQSGEVPFGYPCHSDYRGPHEPVYRNDPENPRLRGCPTPLRIYIAGPYTGGGSFADKENNTRKARELAVELTAKGHWVHCPHEATHDIDCILKSRGIYIEYDHWMQMDLSIIERWANALFYMGSSPGANREKLLAEELGLPVFTDVGEVPDLNESVDGG